MKRKGIFQLYSVVNHFEPVFDLDEDISSLNLSLRSSKKMAFVRWPSRKPCEPINMYLLDNYEKWTGDTVVREASKLSELVRYCASNKISFSELRDKDIACLISNLEEEPSTYNPFEKMRDNNSTRKIMQTCFSFLIWFQDNLHFHPIRLIGSKQDGASIVVERRKNNASGHYYFHHRYLPPTDSPDPKVPIATEMIEQTEAIIDFLYHSESYNGYAKRRFSNNESLFSAFRDYITARREFMIFLMRRTGLRPGEMHSMSVNKNLISLRDKSPFLLLPTLKQRNNNPPLRKFFVTRNDAPRFLIYFKAREDWFNFCRDRDPTLKQGDAIFLSTENGAMGMPISKSGIEKDFGTLCELAGFGDQQCCFSMFRHRFITELVLFHLKELGLPRFGTLKQDFRVVLEKVREKTGHKQVDSLWPYINLAYDFGEVFAPVEQAIRRVHASEIFLHEMVLLRREMREGKTVELSGIEVCGIVIDRITSIISSTKNVILS